MHAGQGLQGCQLCLPVWPASSLTTRCPLALSLAAGLPFATNAIFFAEPECSPKVLLQRGMHELLATAGDEGLESWPR